MRALLGCTLVTLAFGLSLSADDKKDEKIDAKKLIGKWSAKDPKDGSVVEFLKDGKLMVDSRRDKEQFGGTYKVDGATLTVTLKFKGEEKVRVMTITKLTDTELVTTDEDGKKEETLVRIKDK